MEAEMTVHLEKYSNLDARVNHLDNRVSSIAEDVSSMKSAMDGLSSGMSVIMERITQPPTPQNWVGIGSLLLALCLAGGGFVTLRLAPVDQDIRDIKAIIHETHDLHSRMARELALATNEVADEAGENESQWSAINELRKEVADLKAEAEASRVSRKAIGDYVKEKHQ